MSIFDQIYEKICDGRKNNLRMIIDDVLPLYLNDVKLFLCDVNQILMEKSDKKMVKK